MVRVQDLSLRAQGLDKELATKLEGSDTWVGNILGQKIRVQQPTASSLGKNQEGRNWGLELEVPVRSCGIRVRSWVSKLPPFVIARTVPAIAGVACAFFLMNKEKVKGLVQAVKF